MGPICLLVALLQEPDFGRDADGSFAQQGKPPVPPPAPVVSRPAHVHDFQATVLHLLGLNPERLTYRFQGRDFRLTDVHGSVVKERLA
jgi:hypothetical protein